MSSAKAPFWGRNPRWQRRINSVVERCSGCTGSEETAIADDQVRVEVSLMQELINNATRISLMKPDECAAIGAGTYFETDATHRVFLLPDYIFLWGAQVR